MAAFDWKKLSTSDRVIAITGLIALIALFLPWETASDSFGSYSASGTSSGFLGWFGALLVIAAGVYIVALRSGTNMPKTSYGPGVIVLGLSVIGAVLIILRWVTLPRGHEAGYAGSIQWGAGYGLYLTLIAAIVQAVFAIRMFRSSGEALPWAK
jgi:uncharacterized membrane protein